MKIKNEVKYTALIKYEAARQALAEAHSIDEVKDIRDKATAMEAYARQANDRQFQLWAAEIKLRAERRAGELLEEMDKHPPGPDKQDRSPDDTDLPPTLADLGIGKKQSSQWQKEASVTEEEFEAFLKDHHDKGKMPTSAGLIQWGIRKEKAQENADLKKRNETLPVIDRVYHCIIMDPPWPMEKIVMEHRPYEVGFDYPTMAEDELTAINIPAADDCHLFLWTTHKHLPMALRLLGGWGFKYVCTFVWHKAGGFQPINLPQYNCEFILYARKGAPKFIDTKNFFCCFSGDRREHSRKPDEFYSVIRRVCDAPRIDIFSREERPGFDQYGNEEDKFNAA